MRRFSLSLLIALSSIAAVSAQTLPSQPFSIERLNEYPLIDGRSPTSPSMSPDGKQIVFGWNKTGDRKLDVWIMDYPDGKPHEILDADKIKSLPNQDDTRTPEQKKEEKEYDGGISRFVWSPDSKQIAFSYKGRIWLMNPDGGDLHAMIDANEGARNPQFSPDGKYISFGQGQNVFRLDRSSGQITQLTFISKPETFLGPVQWSPDSKYLMVGWSDSSKVGHATMMDFTKDRGRAETISRDWVGDTSGNSKIGVVGVNGGLINFVDGMPTDAWQDMSVWNPDSKSIAIGWYSLDFQKFMIADVPDITKVGKKGIESKVIYTETAPENYITDWRPILWSKDGKEIFFGTDIINKKFTYRSIMAMNGDGTNLHSVYAKDYAVGSISRPKDSSDFIIVTAGRSPLETEIREIDEQGKELLDSVVMPDGYSSGKEFDSASAPLFSDDGKEIATEASDRKINSELYSVLPSIKRLTYSQLSDFKKIQWADIKEVTFPGPDGATIHGLLFTPPNMDPNKLHPAVVSDIYADSGKASWGGFTENYLATNLGMVVLCVDFRASWGYGGAFDSGYYKKMGIIDADEAVDAHKYLASLPFVKASRIGIWGWSYGGFLTLMTLTTKPGVYDCGVAVAPVTDWTTYNDWYTRRRLGLPKGNKKIYEECSPISHAAGLQDHLLICHGIVDNNVLFENTAVMIENLIRAGKHYDLNVFPKDDHSISRIHSRPFVFGSIVRYLDEWLTQP